MKKDDEHYRLLAKHKYQKALNLIERAQGLLSDACSELCPLKGAIDEWTLVGKAYDDVHQLWRNVAYSKARDNVDCDESVRDAKY